MVAVCVSVCHCNPITSLRDNVTLRNVGFLIN